jgi:Receptor family ligand binding region
MDGGNENDDDITAVAVQYESGNLPPVDWTMVWSSGGISGNSHEHNNSSNINHNNLMMLAHTRHYENLWWQSQQQPGGTVVLSGVISEESIQTIQFEEQSQLLERFAIPTNQSSSLSSNVEGRNEEEGGGGEQRQMKDLAFCHLKALIPFTGLGYGAAYAYDGAVGVALAVEHLNRGDGSLIKEVEGLNERCNIRFTQQFWDTEKDPLHTLGVVDQIIRRSSSSESTGSANATCPTETTAESLQENESSDETLNNSNSSMYRIRRPCAFLGSYYSSVTEAAALLTSLRGFPQISGKASSSELNDNKTYRYFGRSIPSEYSLARNALEWMWQEQRIAYLAVLYMNDATGRSFARSLRQAARDVAPGMRMEYFAIDSDGGGIPDAIARLRRSQFLFVFCVVTDQEAHDVVMLEAVEQGVAASGMHNWMFADSFRNVLAGNRWFVKDSPLALAYEGTGMIMFSGGEPGNWRFDRFVSMVEDVWNSPNDLEYLASIFPTTPEQDEHVLASNLQNGDKIAHDTAVFNYEATILVGLAACEEAGTALLLNGSAFFKRIVRTEFESMSGDVILNYTTGSRLANTTTIEMLNYRSDGVRFDNETGEHMVRFRPFMSHQRTDNGSWERKADFIFNDGTNRPPLSIPPQVCCRSQISKFLVVRHAAAK